VIEDRVGELRLRLRTDLPEPAEIGRQAESMTRQVLDRCAALLADHAPGRIFTARRLPLRWRLDADALGDGATIEHLASATAAAIERGAMPVDLRRLPTDAEIVVFDGEAHLRAAQLVAAAVGRPAWLVERYDENSGDVFASLAMPRSRALALSVLTLLAEAGMLGTVLAAQSPGAVAVLAAALALHDPDSTGYAADRAAGAVSLAPADVSLLAETVAREPVLTGAARRLLLQFHAAVLLGVGPEQPAATALAAAVATVRPAGEPDPAPIAAVILPIDPGDTTAAAEIPLPIATDCAGLFYLCDRIQELGLAEALWTACLPEGEVLAAAAASLLGPRFAGDPAPLLFGGVATIRVPEVTAEQLGEIAVAGCAALAETLPRRGLAEMPLLTLSLRSQAGGRLLVAAAHPLPFACFAWPADTPESLRAGLHAVLGAWPTSAGIIATPDLAALDMTGRLHPARDRTAPILLPEAPSVSAAALLAVTAGAPCTLFALRVGGAVATAEDFVTTHLARRGHIRRDAEEIAVMLSQAGIDPAVRRAGLDRDPGFLPWLRRSLRFVFE
jgi:hypothetical protein